MIKINKNGHVKIKNDNIENLTTELAMGIAAILEHYPKIKIAYGAITAVANELSKDEVLRIVDNCYKSLEEAEEEISNGGA